MKETVWQSSECVTSIVNEKMTAYVTVDAPGCTDVHASVREELPEIGKEVLVPSRTSGGQSVPGRHAGAEDSYVDNVPLRPPSEHLAQSRAGALVGPGQPDVVEPVLAHALLRRVVTQLARRRRYIKIRGGFRLFESIQAGEHDCPPVGGIAFRM